MYLRVLSQVSDRVSEMPCFVISGHVSPSCVIDPSQFCRTIPLLQNMHWYGHSDSGLTLFCIGVLAIVESLLIWIRGHFGLYYAADFLSFCAGLYWLCVFFCDQLYLPLLAGHRQ